MKYIKDFKLFEETAMATAGNTGGMGAVTAPGVSATPGYVGGSTPGSGDIVAGNTSHKIDAETKKTTSKKRKKRKKRGIGESTEDKETMYVTRFQDWDYPKESKINEDRGTDNLIRHFSDYWSKDSLVKKQIEEENLEYFKKYLNYSKEDWEKLSYGELITIWNKWNEVSNKK